MSPVKYPKSVFKCDRRRNEILGMSFGVAQKNLYRMIILDYLKKDGKDVCFKCGKKIENIQTLSLEHKVAWLNSDNPKELFWDMNNIAFSHLRCNVRDVGVIAKQRPEGTEWCSRCKRFLPTDQFPEQKNSKQRRAVHSYCYACKKDYITEYNHGKSAMIRARKKDKSLECSCL